jgi:hypothetical protein
LPRTQAKCKKLIAIGLTVSSRRKNKLSEKLMLRRSHADEIKYREYKKTFKKRPKKLRYLITKNYLTTKPTALNKFGEM